MADLVFKLSEVGELVLDTWSGTLPTAKACLQLSEQRWFFGCKKDSACFHDAPPLLTKAYAKQVLGPDLDKTESEEANEASQLLFKDIASLSSTKRS